MRNSKSFNSRNSQLSRCPGWLALARLVGQGDPKKVENMIIVESHEISILYHIFEALGSIIPTRHIISVVSSYMWCEALSFTAQIQKSLFSKVTGQQTHCRSDNFSSSQWIMLMLQTLEAYYYIFHSTKFQLNPKRLRSDPDEGKFAQGDLKIMKILKF